MSIIFISVVSGILERAHALVKKEEEEQEQQEEEEKDEVGPLEDGRFAKRMASMKSGRAIRLQSRRGSLRDLSTASLRHIESVRRVLVEKDEGEEDEEGGPGKEAELLQRMRSFQI